MIFQQTLKGSVSVTGVGLHSGKTATLSIKPARSGHGIVFVRTDLEGAPQIAARFENVVSTQLATTLGHGNVTVSTIEHVMAALHCMGVDNAWIEVDGPEIPILDGSSAPFVAALREIGVIPQAGLRPVLRIRRKVEVKVNEKWAVVEPSPRFEVLGSIEWDHAAIGFQEFHYTEGRTRCEEFASARTFCLLRDVEAMKRMGLAKGGSLDNAVVMDDSSVLNPDGLRYPDELARHKVLDALGDFKLAGFPMAGFFRLHRAGHELHRQLLAAIFADSANFEIVDPSSEREELRLAPQIRAMARSLAASVS